ncbi:hypothetical protein, conserved [Eimeria acervulina]|uniref:Protein kinase domain-containing protein n=1 Tax=Eimeria acervulina TaxID=5801 RepID=U6GF10_EIMAC|nr:hypothetical protein, conserved [Eimeria acervulina]CDI77933.1 hypothetical protein, conserved [Eimeria acervulina]
MDNLQREYIQRHSGDPTIAEAGEDTEGADGSSGEEDFGVFTEYEFDSNDAVPISETHRSRRKWSLLTFASIAFPTILLFGCLMYASVKAQQKKPTWADLVKPHPSTHPDAGGTPSIEPPWKAPPVDSEEERTSPNAQIVRGVLWEVVNQLEEDDPAVPSQEASRVMKTVAETISRGQSSQLIGMTIQLTKITEVGSGKPLPGPRAHLVTKFIGEGQSSILLCVQDVKTREESALRINLLPANEQSSILATGERNISSQMVRTAQAIMAVRGDTPAAAVAKEKGIAAITSVAKIKGMPDVLHTQHFTVLSTVEKMENIQVTLRDVLDVLDWVPTGTRAFLARHVLKTVLHLQWAGWSNNQINSSSFGVQDDGSVLLFGFESSVPFGSVIPADADVSAVYTEPELLASIVCEESCEFQPIANPKADLWSLGVLLYEILMDGELPFGLSSLPPDEETVAYVVQLGAHASPESLTVDMEYRGIHKRWQSLIVRLLNPDREKRISAEEIVKDFSDLLNGLPEQQVLDDTTFLDLFLQENPNFFREQAEMPNVKRGLMGEQRPSSPDERQEREDVAGAASGAAPATPASPTGAEPRPTRPQELPLQAPKTDEPVRSTVRTEGPYGPVTTTETASRQAESPGEAYGPTSRTEGLYRPLSRPEGASGPGALPGEAHTQIPMQIPAPEKAFGPTPRLAGLYRPVSKPEDSPRPVARPGAASGPTPAAEEAHGPVTRIRDPSMSTGRTGETAMLVTQQVAESSRREEQQQGAPTTTEVGVGEADEGEENQAGSTINEDKEEKQENGEQEQIRVGIAGTSTVSPFVGFGSYIEEPRDWGFPGRSSGAEPRNTGTIGSSAAPTSSTPRSSIRTPWSPATRLPQSGQGERHRLSDFLKKTQPAPGRPSSSAATPSPASLPDFFPPIFVTTPQPATSRFWNPELVGAGAMKTTTTTTTATPLMRH